MKLKYECAICGDEYRLNGFTNHIQRTHKIAYKDYYDKYVEPNTEHICRFCGNECAFSNSHGYYETCNSPTCVRKQQRETMLLRYGKSCRHASKIKVKLQINFPYVCGICGHGCKNHAMLNRHINKEHPDITSEEYYLKYMNGSMQYCEICGEPAKWMGTHYHNVCGKPECTHEQRKRNNAMNVETYRKKVSDVQRNFSKEKKESIKEKRKQTCLMKYNVEHPWMLDEIREKGLKTMERLYDTRCGVFTPKAKETIRKKYNVEHFSNSSEFSKRRKKKYISGEHSFDSKDEQFLYNFAVFAGLNVTEHPCKNFTYSYNGKMHTYEPDFIINDKYYEVKGLQFFESKNPNERMINPFDRTQDELYEAKHQCMMQNQVKILTNINLFSLINEFYNIDLSEEIIFQKCFSKPFPGTEKWPAKHPIWDSFLPGRKSPKAAWTDEKLFKMAIKNMIKILSASIAEGKYAAFCRKHINALINIDSDDLLLELILNRFTIAKIAPKVTALSETELAKIIKETNVDLSSGVYCPMAGFGGIVRGAAKWFKDHNLPADIEAYDINKSFCDWYGWTQRDVLAQTITTEKTVIVCPPFGKEFEHWKGTPDEMSDISFIEWVDLIKEHVKAPKYIFIGPEMKSKNKCGLFSKKTGISYYDDAKLAELADKG